MIRFIPARAVAWVSDEPIPGLVKVELIDAEGSIWEFVDKTSMFDEDDILRPDSHYPMAIDLACTVLAPRGISPEAGELVYVSTAQPWGLETTDGTTEFWIESDRVFS
jgi:hypothetical protein